jgi:WD40 repeat protein
VAVGLLLSLEARPAGEPTDAAAEAELHKLGERTKDPSGDPGRLRSDILAFRLAHPGTPFATRASALLAHLRSPLDNLNPANIPPLERFAWQPKELVGVVGEHRGRHASPVSCVAFSPDGTLVASGGTPLYVRLWDPATLRLHAIVSHNYVTGVAFSRDSKTLAVSDSYGNLAVWDVSRPKEPKHRFSVRACTSTAYGVACSPDNKHVAVACFDNAVRIYDISGEKIEETATLNGHTKAVTAVAYSPDGKMLVSGSQDLSLRFWEVAGRDTKERYLLDEHKGAITALAFTPKGGALASAGADGTLVLWNTPAGAKPKPRVAFQPKAGTIAALSFSASGRTLAGACSDGTARLWNVERTPRELAAMKGHAGAVNGVAFAPDNLTVVTGSADWTVRSWDVKNPARPAERFMPWSHLSHVYAVDFSLELDTLVSGSEDRVIRLWDLTKPELKTRNYLKGESVPIYTVAYSPSGKLVAAGGASGVVHQWDARTGRSNARLTGPEYVNQLLYSPDSRQLLTRGRKNLILWDTHRSAEVRRFATQDMDIHCSAWSPDGRFALTGHGVPLIKDGKYVIKDGAQVYTDCIVRMFDVQGGEEVYCNKDFKLPVYSAGFSPDGRHAYTGLYEPSLHKWVVTPTGLKQVPGLKGTSGYVHALLFSPDGRSLVTRGLDGQVVVWDLATGKQRRWTFQEQIGHMAYASDSRHLAVSLGTGVVYLLRLDSPAGSDSR